MYIRKQLTLMWLDGQNSMRKNDSPVNTTDDIAPSAHAFVRCFIYLFLLSTESSLLLCSYQFNFSRTQIFGHDLRSKISTLMSIAAAVIGFIEKKTPHPKYCSTHAPTHAIWWMDVNQWLVKSINNPAQRRKMSNISTPNFDLLPVHVSLAFQIRHGHWQLVTVQY